MIDLRSSGAVKSIQRGCSTIGSNRYVDITINKINMEKSIIIVESYGIYTSYEYLNGYNTAGAIINDNTIRLRSNGSSEQRVDWQVIEFY